MGLLVSGEMANAYLYDADYAARFTREQIEAIERDYNHPSIIMWIRINENCRRQPAVACDKIVCERATLAQLVERLIRNQQVAGSIPAGGSTHEVPYNRKTSCPPIDDLSAQKYPRRSN